MQENNSLCYLFLFYIFMWNNENGNEIGGKVMFSFFKEMNFTWHAFSLFRGKRIIYLISK